MIKTVILVVAAFLAGDTASLRPVRIPRDAAAVCPVDNAGLRERVTRLIGSPGAQPFRQRDGWGNVNPANLRVLTDATHAGVCQWLRDNVKFPTTDRVTSYYVADGYYFVATERTRVQRPGTVILGGWEPVIVVRSNLTLVGSYAS